MRRKIFFWLERLKVAPSERKTLSGLMILLVVLGGINMALSPSIPFENSDYLELEQQFEKRTAMLKTKEQELMKQYFPPRKKKKIVASSLVMSADTTDSTALKKEEKEPHDDQIEVININKANMTALESLPGIGPTYARRILKYRKNNNGFENIEELKNIKGIAQKRLEKLKPFVKLKDSK